jgi:hypothetical protein
LIRSADEDDDDDGVADFQGLWTATTTASSTRATGTTIGDGIADAKDYDDDNDVIATSDFDDDNDDVGDHPAGQRQRWCRRPPRSDDENDSVPDVRDLDFDNDSSPRPGQGRRR